jgi:hypothetical protein
MRLGFAIAFCVALVVSAQVFAQVQPTPMKNQDVIDLVSLGIGDDVVIEKIHAAPATNFDTGVDALKALKAAKVSDAVMKAFSRWPDCRPASVEL